MSLSYLERREIRNAASTGVSFKRVQNVSPFGRQPIGVFQSLPNLAPMICTWDRGCDRNNPFPVPPLPKAKFIP